MREMILRLKSLSTKRLVSSSMKCKFGNPWGRYKQSGKANGQECESRENMAKVTRTPTLKVLPGFTKDFQLSILKRDSTKQTQENVVWSCGLRNSECL